MAIKYDPNTKGFQDGPEDNPKKTPRMASVTTTAQPQGVATGQHFPIVPKDVDTNPNWKKGADGQWETIVSKDPQTGEPVWGAPPKGDYYHPTNFVTSGGGQMDQIHEGIRSRILHQADSKTPLRNIQQSYIVATPGLNGGPAQYTLIPHNGYRYTGESKSLSPEEVADYIRNEHIPAFSVKPVLGGEPDNPNVYEGNEIIPIQTKDLY